MNMQELTLGETLEISDVTGCRKQWEEMLETAPSEIRIAVDHLTRIDTAGLQLLLALKKEAAELRMQFSFSDVSEQLQSQADLVGLSSLLFNHITEPSTAPEKLALA